ncbi:MAG: hypothetical protein ACPG4Z_08690 [Chitinophagales bacterium]
MDRYFKYGSLDSYSYLIEESYYDTIGTGSISLDVWKAYGTLALLEASNMYQENPRVTFSIYARVVINKYRKIAIAESNFFEERSRTISRDVVKSKMNEIESIFL